MKTVLELLGLLVIIAGVIGGIGILVYCVSEKWKHLRWTYKYKHRFRIKPTAKCYCHDCKNWNPDTGECGDIFNQRRMGETWFCCFAEPREKAGDTNG